MTTKESKAKTFKTFLIEKGPSSINYLTFFVVNFILFCILLAITFLSLGSTYPSVLAVFVSSAIFTILVTLFRFNQFRLEQKICILTALGNVEDDKDIARGLLWAETEGWPVCDSLKSLNYGFTLEKYHTHVLLIAKDLSEKICSLPPGEEYDKAIAELTKIHETESWKIMTKKEGEEREARRIQQEIKRLVGNTR